MGPDSKVRHLAIYLIKPKYKKLAEILSTDGCDEHSIRIAGHGTGTLYVRRNAALPPKWSDLFAEFVDPASILVAGVAAAFAIEIDGRFFVLTFGQGGRFLLKDDVFEERFGLLSTLNAVAADSLRCVDVQSLDAIQSHSRIQAGQAASSDQFGLNVEQDMLKAVVGTPTQHRIGTRMSGSDSLSVSVTMRLSDLPALLKEYRKYFEATLRADDYDWVNNIALVKSSSRLEKLDAALDARLASRDFKNIWLAIPEIIDWETVSGFMYTHGKREVFTDINMDGFLKSVDSQETITLELLKQRKVMCADADHKEVYRHWSVYKCLYAELDFEGSKYILNGNWFEVAVEFVKRTDQEFKGIPRSKCMLPAYNDEGEGEYNLRVAATLPDQYALLDDKKKIMHGGGHGQVEVCDLLSKNRELIHVKMYAKSSVLSHLFAQGFVSGQLIQIDPAFRTKVRNKLPEQFAPLMPTDEKPQQDQFTIVYAIVSADSGDLHLPFFSRVNLNNTTRILKGFGYRVELLKISVDPLHAKKVTEPPKGRAKKMH